MEQKVTKKVAVEAVPPGKKAAPRPRRQSKVRISPGTWIFIVVLLAAFNVWNFYFLPRMGLTDTPAPAPPVFQVAQHRFLDVVNAQLKTRQSFLTVTTQPVPVETGKSNPFE